MSRSFCAWRQAVLLVFLLVVGLAKAQPTNQMPPPAPRRPSIVLIVADDLGYGDLGCYGQTRIKTPNIDKLASQGIRFTQFYAGSTVCAPSRCALMTGLDTGHALIRGNANMALGADDATLPEVLGKAGYHTGLVGKWGLGDRGSTGEPQKKGFDEFIGFLNQTAAHNYYPSHIDRFDPKSGFNGEEYLFENDGGKHALYIHDVFTTAALNFIHINKPTQYNHYRPFFLELAYTIPHANNEEGSRSGNGMQVPNDAPYSDERWPQPERNKAAMITRLDADVGRLMERLEKEKIDENTIVIFTSDNGPHKEGGVDPKFFQSSGQLRGFKRDLYEGGIRVPLIVRWPAKILQTNQVSDVVWAFWDFLPTLGEIARAKAPPHLDGISMLQAMLGKAQTNQHDFLYWEFHERGFKQAARMGDWKAVRTELGKPLELYNLKQDPGEKQNVAGEHPDIVAKFEEYFKGARTESAQWPLAGAKS